jgi:cysteinyl-tRNA synthetase
MTRIGRKDHPSYGTHVCETPLPLKDEEERIQRMIDERNEARKQKNFKKADEIRQFLASSGIVIEDKPDGTSRWKR